MPPASPIRALTRWGLNQLYTRCAFGYDWVSAVVSRGEWRAWTQAAIPFVRGTRILEIAFGTGNLHLDLHRAGYTPVGIDLSPEMGALTQKKFHAQTHVPRTPPRLVRSRVQHLPFPDASFSSLVMTFPPGFVRDLDAMQEMWRVLEPRGVLLWVDAPRLHPRDLWSRFLSRLFVLTGGCANPETDEITTLLREAHDRALSRLWTWRAERVELTYSTIYVFIGTKNASTG